MLKYYDEHFFIACQRKNYCQKFFAGLLFSFSISVQIKFITALFDLKYELVCQVTRNSFACQDGQDNTENVVKALKHPIFWSYLTCLLEGFLYNVPLGVWQAQDYAMNQVGYFYWQGKDFQYLTYTRIFGLICLIYSIGIMITGFTMDFLGIWYVTIILRHSISVFNFFSAFCFCIVDHKKLIGILDHDNCRFYVPYVR